ncbi:MAG: hypothetical protein RJB01_1828 [Actinomycetota bacterium]|jgi:hypothetical protein
MSLILRKPLRSLIILPVLFTSLLVALVAATPASAKPSTERIAFSAGFTSQNTSLTELPGGHKYGWNDLTAAATINGQQATVRFQGSVDYTNGSGPFDGFITITFADNTQLALVADGDALLTDSGTTDFTGRINTITGTGKYKGVTGIGTMRGSRSGELGAPVSLTFRLTLGLK